MASTSCPHCGGSRSEHNPSAATITAAMVTALRDKTDQPMMRCKRALVLCHGDMVQAERTLQEPSKWQQLDQSIMASVALPNACPAYLAQHVRQLLDATTSATDVVSIDAKTLKQLLHYATGGR